MRFLLPAALIIAALATLVILPMRLSSIRENSQSQALAIIGSLLLIVAGLLSALLALISLLAAAWGLDTTLPWGLGIYMYLVPVLSFPAFFLLKFSSLRILSRALWLLTIASSFAYYFGDKADRIASGFPPLPPSEKLGMIFNAFTLYLIAISVLVQLSVFCKIELPVTTNGIPTTPDDS